MRHVLKYSTAGRTEEVAEIVRSIGGAVEVEDTYNVILHSTGPLDGRQQIGIMRAYKPTNGTQFNQQEKGNDGY